MAVDLGWANSGLEVMQFSICNDSGTAVSYLLDSEWIFGTSGECWFLEFVSLISQTNAALTLYALPTSVTGTPTFKLEIRDGAGSGEDPDRPDVGGAALATSGDTAPTANEWCTFTIASVTLVQGQTYFAIIYNSSADRAANKAEWQYRSAADGHTYSHFSGLNFGFRTGYNADGFASSDGTASSAGPAVMKYSDNTIVGFPYSSSTTHASNTNDRGTRVQFSGGVTAVGLSFASLDTTNLSGIKCYQGSDTIISITSLDEVAKNRFRGTVFAPTALSATTDYDFVAEYSGARGGTMIYGMTEAEGDLPADVLASRPKSAVGYIDGAEGSYSVDTSKVIGIGFFFY